MCLQIDEQRTENVWHGKKVWLISGGKSTHETRSETLNTIHLGKPYYLTETKTAHSILENVYFIWIGIKLPDMQ